MKKILAVTLTFVFLLCGCNKTDNLAIEKHKWTFSVSQNGNNGDIAYCNSEHSEIYPDASVVDIWCSIDDGKILISNNDTTETWELGYSLNSKDPESNIYDVTYKSENQTISGHAVTGITKKYNQNDEYTLIISIGEHTIYFYEVIE